MSSAKEKKSRTAEKDCGCKYLPESFKKMGYYSKDLGVSGMMGLAVGVCAKRLTSDALYGLGLGFLGLQSLNYLGYIQINWKKVEEGVAKVADQNNDGKINSADFKILLERFLRFAGCGLSGMGGFTGGFFLGSKYLV